VSFRREWNPQIKQIYQIKRRLCKFIHAAGKDSGGSPSTRGKQDSNLAIPPWQQVE